jgi:hypothetical protein
MQMSSSPPLGESYGRVGVGAYRKRSDVTLELDFGSIGIREPHSSIRGLALTPTRGPHPVGVITTPLTRYGGHGCPFLAFRRRVYFLD